jgi:hypothetical protein
MLGFEDISYYLQYNARSEFFSKNIFIPNPECKDQLCISNQAKTKASGVSFIESRKLHIASKKKGQGVKYFKDDEVDTEKWQIELIEDSSEASKDNFIKNEDVQESKLEDLMNMMKQM